MDKGSGDNDKIEMQKIPNNNKLNIYEIKEDSDEFDRDDRSSVHMSAIRFKG